MKRSHILLFGANAFGTGLLAPVLSLVLLSHGATMENLSLCIGIFAVMVVVLELPSGILADLIGRKRIFLISANGSPYAVHPEACTLLSGGRTIGRPVCPGAVLKYFIV